MHLEEYGTDYPATHTYGALSNFFNMLISYILQSRFINEWESLHNLAAYI